MRRFRPERLTEAREVRELTMAVLGELVGKSPSSISHYENGHHTPSMDVVIRLSRALNAPVEFFFSDPRPRADGPTFFRSMSAATKRSRRRADIRIDWTWDILRFIEPRVELPTVTIPPLPTCPGDRSANLILRYEQMTSGVIGIWETDHSRTLCG